jgi:hypothetical protein
MLKGQTMKTCKTKLKKRKARTQFLDSTNIVDCPRRFQRRMWRNIRKAAVCKVNLDGKIRARELVDIAEACSEPTTPDNKVDVIAMKTDTTRILAKQGAVKPAATEKLQPSQNRFKLFIRQVSSFIKNRGWFHGNNSRRQK